MLRAILLGLIPVSILYYNALPRVVIVLWLFLRREQLSRFNISVECEKEKFKIWYMLEFAIFNYAVFFGAIFHYMIYIAWGIPGLLISFAYPIVFLIITIRIPLKSIKRVERINSWTDRSFTNAEILIKDKALQKILFPSDRFVFIAALVLMLIMLFKTSRGRDSGSFGPRRLFVFHRSGFQIY